MICISLSVLHPPLHNTRCLPIPSSLPWVIYYTFLICFKVVVFNSKQLTVEYLEISILNNRINNIKKIESKVHSLTNIDRLYNSWIHKTKFSLVRIYSNNISCLSILYFIVFNCKKMEPWQSSEIESFISVVTASDSALVWRVTSHQILVLTEMF